MTPETSLSQRVAKGGMWVFALRGVEKILGLIKLVILARLLAPNDFGLFGIALLAMSTLETFFQTGFQSALVQKQGDIAPYLDNAWTVSIIRGTFLFIILFLSAPYIALFFNTPKASSIIQVIGASRFVGGFINSGIVFFQKELEFNKQFLYRLASTLADFIVVVLAALVFNNVWALVIGLLAGSLVGVVASYMIHPYRPRFRLDRSKSRELFGFGKWVFGSSILVFLITHGDDIFVGKMLGVVALAFYQMAYRISNLPATEITHVISQITLPAYSKMQDNLPRLREAYLRVLQLIAFLSFPIAGLILILAPDFTRIFLGGEKWMPMVPAMQILVFAGLTRSIAATTGSVFLAVKRPEIETKWHVVRLLVLAALIYPLTINWGILGTSIAVFISSLVATFGFSFVAVRIIKSTILNFTKMIVPPLLNTMIMVSVMFIPKVIIQTIEFFELFLILGLGFISYLFVTYLLDGFLDYGVLKLIKKDWPFNKIPYVSMWGRF